MSQITEIITHLQDNEKYHKYVQPALREYVTDTSLPLAERFEVWKQFCDKKKAPWVIHKGEYGKIGEWVDACLPYDYERYQVYDWVFFLNFVHDEPEDAAMTEDQFKEMLIDTNFGSFRMDW
jgi:hypothetical protein